MSNPFVPQPGDKLLVNIDFMVPGGKWYYKGDVLELIEPTGQAPWGRKSGICNWLVKCKLHPRGSVWSAIWDMLDRGVVGKVQHE